MLYKLLTWTSTWPFVYTTKVIGIWFVGRVKQEVVIGSKEEAAQCMQKLLRNKVMISSARQAVAGLLTVGVFGGARYVSKKMQKAWKS